MSPRVRYRAFGLAAVASALLGVVTAVLPDWIELVLRVDPDGGDGAAEWIVVLLLWTLAVACGAGAVRARRTATREGVA